MKVQVAGISLSFTKLSLTEYKMKGYSKCCLRHQCHLLCHTLALSELFEFGSAEAQPPPCPSREELQTSLLEALSTFFLIFSFCLLHSLSAAQLQHLFQNGHESNQRPQYLRRRVSLTLLLDTTATDVSKAGLAIDTASTVFDSLFYISNPPNIVYSA